MTAPLTERMASALAAGRPLGLLCEIEHPDGTGRFWTGIGTLAYGGYNWAGIGTLGAVTPVRQTSDIAIQDIQFTLSGVDPDILADLNEDVRNLTGSLWLACFGDKGEVIADPYQLVDALLDYQTLHVGDDGSATISITARTGFYTLDRGIDEAWTPESQKLDYPTDVGLDMIPGLQNQDVRWTPT